MAFISHAPSMSRGPNRLDLKGWIASLANTICGFLKFKGPARTSVLDTLSDKFLRDIGLAENDLSISRKLDKSEIGRARLGRW